MDARVVDFAKLLRTNGVRVSPAEVSDAVVAAALVGAEDRLAFRAALRATLVKRARDVAAFDGLFELYFSGLGRVVEGLERGLLAELREQGLLEGEELELLARTLSELAGGMSPLARAALEGDAAALARLLSGASLQIDPGALASPGATGFHARRL
ncbi:MAG TPA: hypothetical protein VF841_03105, partial [Anaeromyxobacter sp.]